MCGIAGYWTGPSKKVHAECVERMAARLAHRGPDDAGTWIDAGAGLALAHRRLSILDLSEAGHQPMQSPCGRYVLVFNGEIYNHHDLRKELEIFGAAPTWRGHSDTETLLTVLVHWGIEEGLKRLNGMFAFAFFDRSEQALYLARDRMGEKPLYYGIIDKVFLFGSELKALKAHSAWRDEIDREALALYLHHNYIPAPWSIYKDIKKLLPAHYIIIRNHGLDIREPHCYWNLGAIAEAGIEVARHRANPEELVDELDILLQSAVAQRMEADVPLGAFLSGGYDSSMVTALMQQHSALPVRTFSIGFSTAGYNEAPHAKVVADYLGTDHTELYVTPEEAMAVIPELPTIWDEPFADSSQIPTLLVSRLARRHVTVSLSGDGGDELFFGYQRYFLGDRAGKLLHHVPAFLRCASAVGLRSLPVKPLNFLGRCLPGRFKNQALGDRLHKLADMLTAQDGETFYDLLISHWKYPAAMVQGITWPTTSYKQRRNCPTSLSLSEYMMYMDTMSYLPGDILTKLDRASMAVSLEARVPLLDHRLVEFAWRMPTALKKKSGYGKWPLRQVLYRYVPRELVDRPKMGFAIPLEHWLRGPLREWAEDLLRERRLREDGFFDPAPIRQMWREHVGGRRRWHHCLWGILMFQAWLDKER